MQALPRGSMLSVPLSESDVVSLLGENLSLAAVSLDLGSCEIGALFDDEVNAILVIDGLAESTILMAAVGAPA